MVSSEPKRAKKPKRIKVDNDERKLVFRGFIDDTTIIPLLTEMERLHQTNPNKKIVLYIHSEGGSPGSAIHFYDYVKMRGFNLVTVGVGVVFSAALILFLAGQKRLATENTLFLLHETKIVLGGDVPQELKSGDLAELQQTINVLQNQLDDIVFKVTRGDKKKVQYLRKRGITFNAQRAKDAGFVDEVIPTSSLVGKMNKAKKDS